MGPEAPAGRRIFFSIVEGRPARRLEQRGIPAKNASTPQLNAMGIAPKVVGEGIVEPRILMFR